MIHTVTYIPGDGIGPEVMEAARRVIDATGVLIQWEMEFAGVNAQEKYGILLPDSVFKSIRRNKTALKGPMTTPIGTGFRSVNVALRQTLDLYANVRPCKSVSGLNTPFKNVDIVVVRENTEDLYSGIEFEKGSPAAARLISLVKELYDKDIRKDSAISLKNISETASRRIVRFAFEYAGKNNREKVTAGHKANLMKYTDGLFLSVAREIAREYPTIEFEDSVIDALCMRLALNPEQFDVIVLPNLYGDIVSDLCAGLIGGLGLAPGANISEEAAVFEATHGSAPGYAGQNKVNPMALILSGALMLKHIGEPEAADKVEKAIAAVIREGKTLTYDLRRFSKGPAAGTSQVADAIIEKMKEEKDAK